MLQTIASWLGRASSAPAPGLSEAEETERRRRVLREAVLGFDGASASAETRAALARLGYALRITDLAERGLTEAAPVNTWALYPGARREVWLAHMDTADPWYAHAHVFATMDGATYLEARLTPTRLSDRRRGISLHARFGVVVHEYDRPFREGYVSRIRAAASDLWDHPRRWEVPIEGWLPAPDTASVTASLVDLVTRMVSTLERAGPAVVLDPPKPLRGSSMRVPACPLYTRAMA